MLVNNTNTYVVSKLMQGIMKQIKTYVLSDLSIEYFEHILNMADLGWGGVPRMNPSDTALKYLNGFHKILVSKK